MTHRERAEAATAVILAGDYGDVPAETFIAEVIWRACVEASNDELERRRSVGRRARRLEAMFAVEDGTI